MFIQVPLGVLPYNEVEYSEMMKIMEHIQGYVPSKRVETEPNPGGENTVLKMVDNLLIATLVGGDLLTVARMRGAQRIRGNSEKSAERFEGLFPVAEDWHGKVCLLEVRVLISIKQCMTLYVIIVHTLGRMLFPQINYVNSLLYQGDLEATV